MKKLFWILVILILIGIGYVINRPQAPISQKVLTTFGITIPPQGTGYTTGTARIANAASKYCEKKWGTVQILNGPDGRYAMCHLPNGTICEVRSYYRGECGQNGGGGWGGWGWGGWGGNDTGGVNTWSTTGTVDTGAIDPCSLKAPVCALVPGTCADGTIGCPCSDGTACPQVQKTFQNICLMNKVKSAKFLHNGVCTDDPTTPPSSTTK